MSIKRSLTLKDRDIIKQTLSKGQSHQKNCMVAKSYPVDTGGILIFVKKKQIKQAVKRNRIKRIILNTYRELLTNELPHLNIIIFFKAPPNINKVRQLTLALLKKITDKHSFL
jgi:ribonuclease P protein component